MTAGRFGHGGCQYPGCGLAASHLHSARDPRTRKGLVVRTCHWHATPEDAEVTAERVARRIEDALHGNAQGFSPTDSR